LDFCRVTRRSFSFLSPQVSTIERMFVVVKQAMKLLEGAVGQLDPERLGKAASLQLFECFSKIEKLAAAGKALCGLRAADSQAWLYTGRRSPAHYVAAVAGTTVGRACAVLDTAERIQKLPGAEAAYRRDKLSEIQAEEIAFAAELAPDAEQELLWAAERQALAEFRRECARVRAAARSESQRHDYLYRRRRLEHWIDPEGAFRLAGRFTPESGAVILAALEPFRQKASLRGKNRECHSAYLADALLAMAEHSRRVPEDALRPGPGAVVHVRVDYTALQRGQVAPGELCEAAGVGPIPVAAAQGFAADAFLNAVVLEGKEIKAVCHLGRSIPERLRTALIERDPVCVVPGCGEDKDLEIDHLVPVHRRGPTSLHNLARLCHFHHYQKTYHGYVLRRVPGGWAFHPPNGPPPNEETAQPELVAAR
jgi:hypothetical protein